MRVIIILAAIAFTHGAKLERTYLPPSNARTAGGSGKFLQTPVSGSGISGPASGNYQHTFSRSGNDYSGTGFSQGNDFSQSGNGLAETGAEYNNVNFNFANEGRPERPRAALERNAAILRQDSSNDGETYSYAYETENGIYAEESGVATNGVEAQGGYSYTGDDGQVYSVRYTADQNGFVPQGDHLPSPPPVPEEILKALEQNARDEAAGIYDDGSYNDGKYAGANNNNNGYNYEQNNAYKGNNDDTIVTNAALARSGNAPNSNAGIAPIYGAPNAQNYPTLNSAKTITPTYGAPDAPAFNRNAPTFNSNAPSFTTATASNAPNAGISRNSAAEKAYLPPFADQRGQARNAFGRRQQIFNARTGYNY